LAAFSRLILFDKRGTGLSDRAVGIATLEERMDDVRAVMDAVGSNRAALFGLSEGGPMSLLFAATYPERVHALVLYGSGALWTRLKKWYAPENFKKRVEEVDQLWGSGEIFLRRFTPSKLSDERLREFVARWERQSASPSALIAIFLMNLELEIRHVLPAVHVPTLVLHQTDDSAVPVEEGRYLAANIDGAKYIELPGRDHWPVYEREVVDQMIGEIEEFLKRTRSRSSSCDGDVHRHRRFDETRRRDW
jgi:pimeloyl-ACP methyl ester carboxylesterase